MPDRPADRQTRVRSLVCDHVDLVTRTLRGSGVPDRDLDDEIQRTFMIAARRIDDIRPGTERGFLFSVARRMAARSRRTHARRNEVLNGEAASSLQVSLTPEHVAAQKHAYAVFDGILDSIDEGLRSVLILHAFEELNTRETAAALGIPLGTVASRLRRGRAQLRVKIAAAVAAGRVSVRFSRS